MQKPPYFLFFLTAFLLNSFLAKAQNSWIKNTAASTFNTKVNYLDTYPGHISNPNKFWLKPSIENERALIANLDFNKVGVDTILMDAPFTANIISQKNVSRNQGNNGSATVVVNGGTFPYTYSWSPSGGTAATASGLQAGAYTVIVTDVNASTTAAMVLITQPPQ